MSLPFKKSYSFSHFASCKMRKCDLKSEVFYSLVFVTMIALSAC